MNNYPGALDRDEIRYEVKAYVSNRPLGNNSSAPAQIDTSTYRRDDHDDDRIKLTPKQAYSIWRMLPPRITGMKPERHPLGHMWFGAIITEKDKDISRQVRELLNITE